MFADEPSDLLGAMLERTRDGSVEEPFQERLAPWRRGASRAAGGTWGWGGDATLLRARFVTRGEQGRLAGGLRIGWAGLPVAVDAAGAAAGAVVSVVDHAVDYRGEMLRDADDEAAGWEFVRAKVDRAAGADPHGGSPDPAERVHYALDGGFVDAGASVALAAFSCAGALVDGSAVHEIVDVLVGETGGDGDGADYAVAGFAAVAGCGAAAVMESETLWHARSWAGSRLARPVRRWPRRRLLARRVCRW